jgi:predicted methyltransferase
MTTITKLNMTLDKVISTALSITLTSVTLFSLISYNANGATGVANYISDAVKNTYRPVEDLTLDVDRKPAQILNFFQVTPNSQVLELFAGGGYYTELLNDIVGKDGHVTVYEDSMWYDYSKSDSDKRHMGKRLKNTHTVISDMNTLKLPKEEYDTALIVLGLHDIYIEEQKSLSGNNHDMTHLFNALYHSLKSGGVIGIIEHEAKAGQQPNISAELHRLNSKFITKHMLAAGFTLEASSDLLANANDDHTQIVWAKGLRRKTDRSVLRFRKPQ